MKLCIVSDGLGHLSFRDAAKAAGELGIEGFEIGTGNWSLHLYTNLKTLLGDKRERSNFLSVLQENGLALAALQLQWQPTSSSRRRTSLAKSYTTQSD